MMNQARQSLRLLAAAALATGLVAGAARAEVRTPIDACGTIDQPGSYVLTRNLTASGDCIVINADNATLDLNGFAIMGDGTGNGVRNGVFSLAGTTVRNGTIANFGDGVDLAFSLRCHLRDLRVLNGAADGIKVNNTCIISSNVSAGNLSSGISVNSGFGAFDEHALILGNVSRGNGSFGIEPNAFTVVAGNVVEGNDFEGMRPRVGSLVSGNTIHNNTDVGILHGGFAGAPSGLAVTNNAVTVNGAGGIEHFPTDDGTLLFYNVFRSNTGGNQVGACTSCTLIHNLGIANTP